MKTASSAVMTRIRLARQRILVGLRGSGKEAVHRAAACPGCCSICVTSRVASLSETPLRQVERDGDRREQPGVVHLQRRGVGAAALHHGEQRRHGIEPGAAGGLAGSEVDVVQPRGILPVLRRHFQHHVILVELRVDDRDFRLAEGAVERRCRATARSAPGAPR